MTPGEAAVSDAERVMTYNALNAPIRIWPYPHIYVEDVFPADFYAELQRNIPAHADMAPIEKVRPVRGYKERFVLQLGGQLEGLSGERARFWEDLSAWLLSGRFRDRLLARFRPLVSHRFEGVRNVAFRDEALLVEDLTNYALGPHTDAVSKVITVIFYLPRDDSQARLGTSLYTPKDPARRCDGGPHYDRAGFDLAATMPFRPNSMFAFVKSDNTFHGVEPVTEPDVRRWLLLYDIKASIATPPAATP